MNQYLRHLPLSILLVVSTFLIASVGAVVIPTELLPYIFGVLVDDVPRPVPRIVVDATITFLALVTAGLTGSYFSKANHWIHGLCGPAIYFLLIAYDHFFSGMKTLPNWYPWLMTMLPLPAATLGVVIGQKAKPFLGVWEQRIFPLEARPPWYIVLLSLIFIVAVVPGFNIFGPWFPPVRGHSFVYIGIAFGLLFRVRTLRYAALILACLQICAFTLLLLLWMIKPLFDADVYVNLAFNNGRRFEGNGASLVIISAMLAYGILQYWLLTRPRVKVLFKDNHIIDSALMKLFDLLSRPITKIFERCKKN